MVRCVVLRWLKSRCCRPHITRLKGFDVPDSSVLSSCTSPQRKEHFRIRRLVRCGALLIQSMLLPVVCPDLLITSQGRNAPNSLTRSRKTLLVFSR
ncbi:hypothetical protein FDI66_gp78 [Aeromonas phage pIS4-A]|uniref:Uncharacterized protein n=2 Tax=Roufvirus pIS4A TaxID=1982371 RepID=R9TR16_9CAUD|nr:hypothetical protein VPRG_00076 [Vibrio phage pYD38-A]YP_009614651.1 hypothetical protein FDI66_gp78 [Aeromonas phage pIS4-A]AGN34102.1 hypothetical protein AEPG_00055 [Aeromonas phage pIS4-A]AGN34317.1 hypothetical protein VPRG_00076 [Vibrio phage pYD38-A]